MFDVMEYDSVKNMPYKTAGHSGVANEMVTADGKVCMEVIADSFIKSIIRVEKGPKGWEEKYIINTYKEKDDTLSKQNYRGLMFLKHVIWVSERTCC